MLLWVTLSGKDIYPFSHYPMFSALHRPGEVKVLRIALEKQSGEVTWWQSVFYRRPHYVASKIDRFYKLRSMDNQKNAFISLQRNKYLLEALRLIKCEEGDTGKYVAFHIIERSVSSSLEIQDKTLDVIPFSQLKHGTFS